MQFKLKNNNLITTDIIQPEYIIATFSDSLTKQAMQQYANDMNYGIEFVRLYEQMRDNMHIKNVTDMLEQMETLFHRYAHARAVIKNK